MRKLYIWITLGIIAISVNLAKNFSGLHTYRSIHVYELIKNTNWPERKKSGNYVIGVFGNPNITDELKELAKVNSAGKDIIVNEIYSISEVQECNLIYVS